MKAGWSEPLGLGLFPAVELPKSGGPAPTFHRASAVASGAVTPRLGARRAGVSV